MIIGNILTKWKLNKLDLPLSLSLPLLALVRIFQISLKTIFIYNYTFLHLMSFFTIGQKHHITKIIFDFHDIHGSHNDPDNFQDDDHPHHDHNDHHHDHYDHHHDHDDQAHLVSLLSSYLTPVST